MINLASNSDLNQQPPVALGGGLSRGDAARARQAPSDDTTPNLLAITTTAPLIVNLQLGSGNALAFSLPNSTTSAADGINWTPTKDIDTALFISFSFSSTTTSTITGVTCPYSQVAYGPTVDGTQCISIQPSRKTVEFSFKVHTAAGAEIDPKIKITPT